MKRFRVVLKGSDGSVIHMNLMAKDRDEAENLANEYQYRRKQRFGLTFNRLDEAAETGKPGLLAIDPRMTGAGLTEAWVKAEKQKRLKDQARYDGKGFSIVSVEEEK